MTTQIDNKYRELCEETLSKYSLLTLEEIEVFYNEEHRTFHTNDHLNDIFSKLVNDKRKLSQYDKDVLVMSTLFHDIVYEPSSTHNEEESVIIFEKYSNGKDEKVENCVRNTILDTKFHNNKTRMSTIFNIYDMSIVYSTNIDELMDWELKIREEYKVYSDEKYKKGRLDFLSNWSFFNPSLKELYIMVEKYY